MSDLTGRVDELEQEASDLRRENGWLKEIVMLKSKRATGDFLPPASDAGGEGKDGTDKSKDKGEGSSKDRDT